jgi:hypothetical protein
VSANAVGKVHTHEATPPRCIMRNDRVHGPGAAASCRQIHLVVPRIVVRGTAVFYDM